MATMTRVRTDLISTIEEWWNAYVYYLEDFSVCAERIHGPITPSKLLRAKNEVLPVNAFLCLHFIWKFAPLDIGVSTWRGWQEMVYLRLQFVELTHSAHSEENLNDFCFSYGIKDVAFREYFNDLCNHYI